MAVIISDMQRELDALNARVARLMQVEGRHLDAVTISMGDLLELIRRAEDYIIECDTEYSSMPTDEDRIFMLRMWKLAGQEVPDWFREEYGWAQEN